LMEARKSSAIASPMMYKETAATTTLNRMRTPPPLARLLIAVVDSRDGLKGKKSAL
jgi:hypothetical protein